MPNSVVLDSYAVVAFLEAEPGHIMMGELFQQAARGERALGLCVVNLGEVWYHFAREQSEAIADEAVRDVHHLGVEIVPADWELTKQAAIFKARGGLSYADCFSAALAKAWDAPLVTGDLEFKRVEKEIKIQWLAR